METKLVVLKRFLEGLGQPSSIKTVAQRKAVQKAVYLGQALANVDLGYRFGWYLMGPYSPPLAKDYYALASAEAIGDTAGLEKDLNSAIKANLAAIKQVFQPPEEVAGKIAPEAWLELLASWHYLRSVSRYDVQRTEETMRAQKSHLSNYLEYAAKILA